MRKITHKKNAKMMKWSTCKNGISRKIEQKNDTKILKKKRVNYFFKNIFEVKRQEENGCT